MHTFYINGFILHPQNTLSLYQFNLISKFKMSHQKKDKIDERKPGYPSQPRKWEAWVLQTSGCCSELTVEINKASAFMCLIYLKGKERRKDKDKQREKGGDRLVPFTDLFLKWLRKPCLGFNHSQETRTQCVPPQSVWQGPKYLSRDLLGYILAGF